MFDSLNTGCLHSRYFSYDHDGYVLHFFVHARLKSEESIFCSEGPVYCVTFENAGFYKKRKFVYILWLCYHNFVEYFKYSETLLTTKLCGGFLWQTM